MAQHEESGPGSTAWATTAPTTIDPAPTALERAQPVSQRLRTFIVDDSPIVMVNLIATLEELTPVLVVGNAPDEESALRALAALQQQAQPLDLVITDLYLRSGSGFGVLRGSPRDAARHVVLSNYVDPEMREKCRALGADRVFDKSRELDELINYCIELSDAPAR